jgi:hypothetical protein
LSQIFESPRYEDIRESESVISSRLEENEGYAGSEMRKEKTHQFRNRRRYLPNQRE